MDTCKNCGSPLQAGQKYCPQCGTAVPSAVAPTIEQTVVALQERVAQLENSLQTLVEAMAAKTSESTRETGLRAWIAKNF